MAWMRGTGESVRGAGDGLTDLATVLGAQETTLRTTLVGGAQAMGWRGQVEGRARETSGAGTPWRRSGAT